MVIHRPDVDGHSARFPRPAAVKAASAPGGRTWRSPSHEDGLRHGGLRARVVAPGRLGPAPRPRGPASRPAPGPQCRPGLRGNRSPGARSQLQSVLTRPSPPGYNQAAPRPTPSVTTLRVILTTRTIRTSGL